MTSLKKPLLLFILFVVLLALGKMAYSKYCASKEEGCKDGPYEDSYLTDDHVDN